jgi:hypothetical protein
MNPIPEIIVSVRKSIDQELFVCVFGKEVLKMSNNFSDWELIAIFWSKQLFFESSDIGLKLNIKYLILAF